MFIDILMLVKSISSIFVALIFLEEIKFEVVKIPFFEATKK